MPIDRLAAAMAILTLSLAACSQQPAADRSPQDATTAATEPSAAARDERPPVAPTPTPAAPAAPSAASATSARFDGYGDVRFGMTADEVRRAWRGELDGAADEPGGCHYLNPVSNPATPHFGLMIDGDRLVRYDVSNDTDVAPGGGTRGMTTADIERLYPGRVVQSPHKYSDGKYLRIAEGAHVLVFETDAAGKVEAWRVGVAPQVDYVEGCS